MTIPFLNLFKRKPVTENSVPAAPPPPPVEKSSADRLSKTVLPNATRSVDLDDSHSKTNGNKNGGRNSYANGRDLPPAVALALEPKVERAISLELGDVVAQMPPGVIRPLQEGDGSRRVLLKAAEIEKGMSSGRPTVSVATLYEQVPEIFLQTVAPSDARMVPLPFDKVMEQFTKVALRSDQYREMTVPQVETPFLQVTLEDNTRFGTTLEPIQTGELPPVRVEAATAESLAAAEPEAVPRAKFSLNTPPPPSPIGFRVMPPVEGRPKPISIASPVPPPAPAPAAP